MVTAETPLRSVVGSPPGNSSRPRRCEPSAKSWRNCRNPVLPCVGLRQLQAARPRQGARQRFRIAVEEVDGQRHIAAPRAGPRDGRGRLLGALRATRHPIGFSAAGDREDGLFAQDGGARLNLRAPAGVDRYQQRRATALEHGFQVPGIAEHLLELPLRAAAARRGRSPCRGARRRETGGGTGRRTAQPCRRPVQLHRLFGRRQSFDRRQDRVGPGFLQVRTGGVENDAPHEAQRVGQQRPHDRLVVLLRLAAGGFGLRGDRRGAQYRARRVGHDLAVGEGFLRQLETGFGHVALLEPRADLRQGILIRRAVRRRRVLAQPLRPSRGTGGPGGRQPRAQVRHRVVDHARHG